MGPHESSPDSGGYDSIEEANRAVPFALKGPSDLPPGYRLTQIAVEEPNENYDGWHAWMVYVSESGDPSEHLLVSARPTDDPNVPGHPYGVDQEVTVNGRPGTYARARHRVLDPPLSEDDTIDRQRLENAPIVEGQNSVLGFIDNTGTFYYLNGPCDRGELIRIAESIG